MVPARAHDAHELEAAQDQRRDGRIHAAGDDGVQHAAPDVAEGVADGVGGGSAAGGDDMAQAAEAEAHGDFAGERADGAGGNGVDAALLLLAGVIEAVLLLGEILAAAAGADHDADLAQFVARHGVRVEAGIRQRFRHAGRGQRHGARYVRPVLHLHVPVFVEFVGHLARDLYHETADGSKRVMRRHPAAAVSAGLPKTFTPDPIGAHGADSRNHNMTHCFCFALILIVSIG